MHQIREELTTAYDVQTRQDLLDKVRKMEHDAEELEQKIGHLMVPDFVVQKKLRYSSKFFFKQQFFAFRTNMNSLIGLASNYQADLPTTSSSNSTPDQEEQTNANWDKFIDICDEVRLNHKELEQLLDELDEEPGQTKYEVVCNVKSLTVNFEMVLEALLERTYYFKTVALSDYSLKMFSRNF